MQGELNESFKLIVTLKSELKRSGSQVSVSPEKNLPVLSGVLRLTVVKAHIN
jgi:hypothetical protein